MRVVALSHERLSLIFSNFVAFSHCYWCAFWIVRLLWKKRHCNAHPLVSFHAYIISSSVIWWRNFTYNYRILNEVSFYWITNGFHYDPHHRKIFFMPFAKEFPNIAKKHHLGPNFLQTTQANKGFRRKSPESCSLIWVHTVKEKNASHNVFNCIWV